VFGETALAFDPGFQRDRIPPLPFDGRQLVLQSIDFFDRIREFLNRPQ
jgi:hypothetical protein